MSRVTEAQRQAVVGSIISQRLKAKNDTFSYDYSVIADKLKTSDDCNLYGITDDDQKMILDELAEAGDIRLDYLIQDDAVGSRWKYGHDWSIEHCFHYEENQDDLLIQFFNSFINLRLNEIRGLKIKYGLPFKATLRFNCGSAVINCDSGSYELPTFKGGSTLSILEYAWERDGAVVSRDELCKELKITGLGSKSLLSVFKGNKYVLRVLLAPFVDITGKTICIKKQVGMSYDHLKKMVEYTILHGHIKQ